MDWKSAVARQAPELRQARRLVIGVVGATLLAGGVVMLVTPGPGIVVIFAGLSVLAAEFVWARRLLKRFKAEGRKVKRRLDNFRKTAAGDRF